VTRHVVEERIPVDINVLCSFIERICSYLIVFNRYKYARNLHNVVLPRSWLNRVLRQFNPEDALLQEKSTYWPLLQPLGTLLEALYFRQNITDHLLLGYGLRSITNTGNLHRSLYIARMWVKFPPNEHTSLMFYYIFRCRILGLREFMIGALKGYFLIYICSWNKHSG